jgi:transposase
MVARLSDRARGRTRKLRARITTGLGVLANEDSVRTLHTGADLLTEKQHSRLSAVFRIEDHVEVEATRGHPPADGRRLPAPRQAGRESSSCKP